MRRTVVEVVEGSVAAGRVLSHGELDEAGEQQLQWSERG